MVKGVRCVGAKSHGAFCEKSKPGSALNKRTQKLKQRKKHKNGAKCLRTRQKNPEHVIIGMSTVCPQIGILKIFLTQA